MDGGGVKGKKKNIVLSNGERTAYKCKIRVSDLIAQLVESFQLTPPRGKRAESGGNEESPLCRDDREGVFILLVRGKGLVHI